MCWGFLMADVELHERVSTASPAPEARSGRMAIAQRHRIQDFTIGRNIERLGKSPESQCALSVISDARATTSELWSCEFMERSGSWLGD